MLRNKLNTPYRQNREIDVKAVYNHGVLYDAYENGNLIAVNCYRNIYKLREEYEV